ncbi:hypothetical protein TRFO_35771 [Tritrichomonas foetus]|uniref:Importin N-terminal domain-containing protein n=1 Tax=Tritrichomonas foetus TaxID=1144522 RepID=A0A1J4JK70_9EUKA|nr:hypothetical protein TRFO_35771 [Tritrichomonas foetus]|eukprot:OHS97931.1 hypothetical protein TRFO_35771 [Tritrichomonas foetus]
MITQEELISRLEQDGKFILSNPKYLHQPVMQINTSPEQILFLFHNIRSIESHEVVCGLLFNMIPFITVDLSSELISQLWIDLINASSFIVSYPQIFGLVEVLRSLSNLCGCVDQSYLDFLQNPQIPAPLVRPYALESLYEYLPAGFLTNDISSDFNMKQFFAEVITDALLDGTIHHRSFMIQLLFALHLTDDQMRAVPNLPKNFWRTVFDISCQENEFYKLLVPVRKLKILVPSFFEDDNESIESVLTDINEKARENIENCLPIVLNCIKVFPYFSIKYTIQFIDILISIFDGFDLNHWRNIKEISHLIFESIYDARFTPDQIKATYNFTANLPLNQGNFFLSIHFNELFSEFYDFSTPFLDNLVKWKEESHSFNAVIYFFCVTELSEFLCSETNVLYSCIVPSIFDFLENSNHEIVVYSAIKALKHLYREDAIKTNDFLNTFFDLTQKTNPLFLKFYFSLIKEIEEYTSEYDNGEIFDDDDPAATIENGMTTKDKLKRIHSVINMFVRSNIMKNDLHPIFYGYLLELFVKLMKDKEPSSMFERCFSLCKFLLSQNEYFHIFPQVASFILNALRYSNDTFLPISFQLYETLMNYLIINYPPTLNMPTITTGNIETEMRISVRKVLADIAYYCSYIAEEQKFDNNFEFSLKIVLDFMNSNVDSYVECSLNIFRRFIPLILTEIERFPPLFNLILSKVMNIAKESDKLSFVNNAYNIFIKIVKQNNKSNIESLYSMINEMKLLGFQERFSLLNHQSIFNLSCLHFNYFKFLQCLINVNIGLTPNELAQLVQWISSINIKLLPDLLMPVSEALFAGLYQTNNNYLNHLWSVLNYRIKENICEFTHFQNSILSLVETINDFLSNIPDPTQFETSGFSNQLEYIWNIVNDTPNPNLNSDDDDDENSGNKVISVIAPIILNVYALTGNILNFNYTILEQIGLEIIEDNIDRRDYPKMVADIISIYQRFGTLHLFSNVGAQVLFHFVAMGNISKKYFIDDEKRREMFDVLTDMIHKDSRIYDYLKENYINSEDDYHFLVEFFEDVSK